MNGEFTFVNKKLSYHQGLSEVAFKKAIVFPTMHYDRQSHGRGKASECIECKMCEGHCPQHIKITEKLKLVAQAFEN